MMTTPTTPSGDSARPPALSAVPAPGAPHAARPPIHVNRGHNPAEDVITHVATHSDVPLMTHLTCIGYRKDNVIEIVHRFLDMGVRRFLALRGDPPPGLAADDVVGDLPHADDLVRVIREVEAEYFDDGARHIQIAVAAYPADIDHGTGIEVLSAKQAAGADLAITQVFYDPDDYLALRRAALYSGVTMPILPGIIPLTDLRRLTRLEALTGVAVPPDLARTLGRAAGRGRGRYRRHPQPRLRGARRRRPRRPPLHLQPRAPGARRHLPPAPGRDPHRIHSGHRSPARSPP